MTILENELAGKELFLRRPALADCKSLYEGGASDSEATRYVTWTTHANVEETKKFLEYAKSTWAGDTGEKIYVIADRLAPEVPQGLISVRRLSNHEIGIGFFLVRQHWGKGVMDEAVSKVLSNVFSDEDIHRVSAACDIENTNSARVLEKCGFKKEGTLRKFLVHPNISRSPRDCFLYSIVRSEYT